MKPTVIHLISSLYRGGRERQLSTLTKYTQKGEYEFTIICFNKVANGYDSEEWMANNVIYLKNKNLLKRFSEIFDIIKKTKPHIIWSWGGFEASFGVLISLFLNIKHVNGSIRHGIVKWNRKQIWRMFLLHFSKYRVANSKAGIKANYLKYGFVLSNGIDNTFFLKKGISDGSATSGILENNDIVLLSIANLLPYKDYLTVIKALKKIDDQNIKFQYHIVGEGKQRDKIIQQIEEAGLNKKIHLHSSLSDPRPLLNIADIFIHSSHGEGLSNAILEAMAAGLPVIATNTGGTPELINESNGRLFDLFDFETLSQHLKELIFNPDLRKNLGKESRRIAMSKFSIKNLIITYVEIIERVINGKSQN